MHRLSEGSVHIAEPEGYPCEFSQYKSHGDRSFRHVVLYAGLIASTGQIYAVYQFNRDDLTYVSGTMTSLGHQSLLDLRSVWKKGPGLLEECMVSDSNMWSSSVVARWILSSAKRHGRQDVRGPVVSF